jgi:glycosyltransferase involved in cell wall biosynthesis
MKFSLVTATLGRTDELVRLFESLCRQTHRDFEIILVDQNGDDSLAPIVETFKDRLCIRHITCEPGLSRARNVGLKQITGEIVGFPDDDCWYPESLLESVANRLRASPECGGFVGDCIGPDGKSILPWSESGGRMTKAMSWRHSTSFAIFLSRKAVEVVGPFDESLGVGSGTPWGSGEDNDFVLRALKLGFNVVYDPSIGVYHPRLFQTIDDKTRQKRLAYSMGDGRLLRKHPMPIWWLALFFTVPAIRALGAHIRLRSEEARFHWLTLNGRIKGYMSQ